MTLAELIPVMPKYRDNSGYCVIVNIPKEKISKYHFSEFFLHQVINEHPELLKAEVEEITAGKCVSGGDIDENLQIWIK